MAAALCFLGITTFAQKVSVYTSTDGHYMRLSTTCLSSKPANSPLPIDEEGETTFRTWGTTFNEQHWRALNMLSETDRDEVMHRFWSPQGDLRLTRGRTAMNANDLDPRCDYLLFGGGS